MSELYYITRLNNIEDFVINNPHIATFIYNTQNEIFNSFEQDMSLLFQESTTFYQTKSNMCALIFYLFLGALLLLIIFQAPIGFFIASIINKEAELFLMISRKEYMRMAKSTNSFLLLLKVYNYSKNLLFRIKDMIKKLILLNAKIMIKQGKNY